MNVSIGIRIRVYAIYCVLKYMQYCLTFGLERDLKNGTSGAKDGKYGQEDTEEDAAPRHIEPWHALPVEPAASDVEESRPAEHDRRAHERTEEALRVGAGSDQKLGSVRLHTGMTAGRHPVQGDSALWPESKVVHCGRLRLELGEAWYRVVRPDAGPRIGRSSTQCQEPNGDQKPAPGVTGAGAAPAAGASGVHAAGEARSTDMPRQRSVRA